MSGALIPYMQKNPRYRNNPADKNIIRRQKIPIKAKRGKTSFMTIDERQDWIVPDPYTPLASSLLV